METIINKIISLIKIFWIKGTSQPIQRVGLIILAIGVMSCTLYSIQSPNHYDIQDILLDPDYYPRYRDPIFYKLYVYFIPLGFLLSWGYPLLQKIQSWILNKPKGDKFLHFQKRKELTEFIRKNWDFKKANNRPALGYVSQVLSPDESYKEALELGFIKPGEKHVLHTDVLLITEHGEQLVFAPCEALGANLSIGDFVLLATYGSEERQDWHYELIAKLRPIYNASKKGWVIESDYKIK